MNYVGARKVHHTDPRYQPETPTRHVGHFRPKPIPGAVVLGGQGVRTECVYTLYRKGRAIQSLSERAHVH